MEGKNVSKRLSTIGLYVKPYRHILDVGTDHCLLPIHLLTHEMIDFAIASDVNVGPLNEGKRHVIDAGLVEQVDLRLGSGLTVIDEHDSVDVVIIAGMGGKLISELLEEGKEQLKHIKRLILQPNVAEHLLRAWLFSNGYTITDETLIEDDGILYEIIVAEKKRTTPNYSEDDLKFGPFLRIEKSTLFFKKWTELLNKKQHILNQIPPSHQNYNKVNYEIEQIKKEIKK
ncbi:tRNA (adenine(22)-N(1))-methyltransferase [Haloplasma contractile]|uniref:tRNA -methyltransferase protein n=1 Tax=Haloplasma contractile SSD-17B TaxID=1033810 RepID=U2FM63_9MOLU|nr:tRNA (adenine(22)-N(1))-methyltransferase TrmK [Haloplasma contractile]ERJ13815.1 tRNA -methyltransferase protein [Haloplasma contractile SSD-17B]